MTEKDRKHKSLLDGNQVFTLASQAAGAAVALFVAPEYYEWRNKSLVKHWYELQDLYNSGVTGAINELNSVADRANHALSIVEASSNWGINTIQLGIIGMFALDTILTPTPDGKELEVAPVGGLLKEQAINALKLGLALAAPVLLTEAPEIVNKFINSNQLLQSSVDVLTIAAGSLSIYKVGSRLNKRYVESEAHRDRIKKSKNKKSEPISIILEKSPQLPAIVQELRAETARERNIRSNHQVREERIQKALSEINKSDIATKPDSQTPLDTAKRIIPPLRGKVVASEEIGNILEQEHDFELRKAMEKQNKSQ